MAEIDAELSDDLPEDVQEFLKPLRCLDLSLGEPGSQSLRLPTGGTIKGIADITKGIPTDCSLSFSLLLQLGPLLASMDCFIKVLKLIAPLINVIKGLPFPPVEEIKKFVEASVPVIECFKSFTFGLENFIKDILCLIIKILKCLVQQFKSIAAVMGGLSLQIQKAQSDGNEELLANLECAKENAAAFSAATAQAIEPVAVILELVGPLLEIAQVGPIEIPIFGPVENVNQINDFIAITEEFIATLQLLADGMGGCE